MKIRPAGWNALVAVLFIALSAGLCTIVHWRYAIFRNGVDLGIFTQVIGGTGRGFSSTAEGGVNHLLVHWSPIVALAWPFLKAFGPVGLEYFQAFLAAAALFPVWAMARTRFAPAVAFALALVSAIYPLLWANGVGDFHEMAFVPLLSATLVYAWDRGRWSLSALAAVLLLCTKEDQFAVLAFNGLAFALSSRGDTAARRNGAAILGLSVAMAVLYFAALRPALNPHVPYLSLGFFDWRQPGAVRSVSAALVWPRLWYVIVVLAPLAFLPCISRYGLFLIPGFIEVLFSQRTVTLAPGAHYSALLTGYALVAFVDGAARLRAARPRLVVPFVAAAATISLAIGIFASPMEYWYYLYRRPNAHDALLEATLQSLPREADVGAEDEIFAHLAADRRASIDFAGQQWFVFDRKHYSQRWHDVDEPAVARALARGAYRLTSERDGIVVLRRAR